jgi:hypothetical protein
VSASLQVIASSGLMTLGKSKNAAHSSPDSGLMTLIMHKP